MNNENLQKPKKLALFSETESLDVEISPLMKSSRRAQEEKTKLEKETAGCESRLNKAQEDIRKLEEDREKRDREKNEDIKGAFLYQRKDELRPEKSPPKLFQLHYQIPKAKLIKQTRPSNHRKKKQRRSESGRKK